MSGRGSNSFVKSPFELQLALQGGGAHGAFTWGVLDRLLEEPSIQVGSVSGTSAGALNGAALVCGLAIGGRPEAKRRLKALWQQIAAVGAPLTWLVAPLRKTSLGVWDELLPLFAPKQANPLGMSPLRSILEGLVEESTLNSPDTSSLFVNAVNVRSGLSKVFGPGELSHAAILASACAPFMFEPVEIDGAMYWDGSYAQNPPLWPLYEADPLSRILLIELSPRERAEAPPYSPKNILNRINEIASRQGLEHELRRIDQLNRSVAGADLLVHVISLTELDSALTTDPSVKRTVSMELFESLHQLGAQSCEAWLESDFAGQSAKCPVPKWVEPNPVPRWAARRGPLPVIGESAKASVSKKR